MTTTEVNQDQVDKLLLAWDSYAVRSTHAQKHLKGDFDYVCSLYAKLFGITKKQAHEHLFPKLP
jgi:hypothetical protein